MEQQPPRVLRTPAAADHLSLAPETLEKWRCAGGGPRFVRLGRRAVGYRITDLNLWLEQQRRESTSE